MPQGGDGEGGRGGRAVEDGGRSLLTRIFGALSHPRRRCVLYVVRDQGPTEGADLARRVAARERDVSVDAVSDVASNRVRVDLRHVHLPKLEDYGFVEYDRRSGTVRYSYLPTVLDELIDLAERFDGSP